MATLARLEREDPQLRELRTELDKLEKHPIHAQIAKAETTLERVRAIPVPEGNLRMREQVDGDIQTLSGRVESLKLERDCRIWLNIPVKTARLRAGITERKAELKEVHETREDIATIDASIRGRYLVGSGFNRTANRERLQLINLKEKLALHNLDHPEGVSTSSETREDIVTKAAADRLSLSREIGTRAYSIAATATAVASVVTLVGYQVTQAYIFGA